ncbi:MAG: beta-N-acetylhexosaminidase [Phycisphaerales bacterium]|nr:MAG: beta-N-acetylhexosaminidase [Phycisphaerales bacterium]
MRRTQRAGRRQSPLFFWLGSILVMVMVAGTAQSADGSGRPVPFVKEWKQGGGSVTLATASITTAGDELNNEAMFLKTSLAELDIPVADGGVPIRLEIASVTFPPRESAYRESIEAQGYRLTIDSKEIVLQARTSAGVFYGIQTLLQLLGAEKTLATVKILDYPDLSKRRIMIDSARQNENAEYYKRLIRFLARHKINGLHWHLSDDQNVALYHEDYLSLMDPHAWRPEQVREMVAYAKRHHIELIPEIESLGHARVFVRHPEYRDILHQTTFDKPTKSWAGTNIPGFTNVLCPASEKTYTYLEKMYDRVADTFPYPETHVGCDEVEMTTCARCDAKFPGISRPDWFRKHLLQCIALASKGGRKVSMWGDMLLHHPETVDGLPVKDVLIYDWHYTRKVSPESAAFFKKCGFEVIACPALMCHPRMIVPDDEQYENIQCFAKIARDLDLLGLDTTIWLPTRYMSDVIWPGVAYAATHAWSGSNWDEGNFYRRFAVDFFASPEGTAFGEQWKDLYTMNWWLRDFYPSCWMDEESLEQACERVPQRREAVRGYLERLERIQKALAGLAGSVKANHLPWQVIERSVAVRAYTMRHLLAAPEVRKDGQWNKGLIKSLDDACKECLAWIEEDWDRNRFADDPNKDGAFMTTQHLLYRFRQMHAFHQKVLNQPAEQKQP